MRDLAVCHFYFAFVHTLPYTTINKGAIEKNHNRQLQHRKAHLLVAICTTSRQTQASAEHKTQQSAQSVGCGCAKAFFFHNN